MNLYDRLLLYIIADSHYGKEEEIAETVLRCGATAVQLRAKDLADRDIYEKAKKIRKIADEYSALFIVNDRVDLAILSGADGVHLGAKDLPIKAVKEKFPELIVGATVRNTVQAKKAIKDGADYLGAGSVFPSPTKKAKVIGVDGLKKIVNCSKVPVVAIGGITLNKIKDVMKTGVCGIAVISGIMAYEDICEGVKKFRKEIFNSLHG